MSSALTALALNIGVPIVAQVLTRRIGAQNAALATDVVGAVARRLGVSSDQVDALAEADAPRVVAALRDVEGAAPEMLALHLAALEGQHALMMAERKGPWWGWAWRPAFMWLLAGLWLWTVVILHIANAICRTALPPIDVGVLLSLTGIYAALYMGGHTVKDWVRITRQGAGQ